MELSLQRSAKVGAPGLVNFITAVAYDFCPSLTAASTQPGASTSADLCTCLFISLPSSLSFNFSFIRLETGGLSSSIGETDIHFQCFGQCQFAVAADAIVNTVTSQCLSVCQSISGARVNCKSYSVRVRVASSITLDVAVLYNICAHQGDEQLDKWVAQLPMHWISGCVNSPH